MNRLVIDCSVTMAWCFADEANRTTDQLLASLDESETLAPSIWPLEVANVLLVAERRGRITSARSARFVDLLVQLPIWVEETDLSRTTGEVLAIGRDYSLSAYDAAYLDLAMRTGSALASRDRRLRSAARQAGVEVFA